MSTPFSRTTRALGADTGRRALWAWALALVLGGAWLAWFALARITVWEVSRQARVEVQQAAHPVVALQGGALLRSQLELGRSVKAGQVLVELDDRAARAQLDEAVQRHAALPARQAALRDEIDALQAALANDRQAAEATHQAAVARAGELAAQLDFAREHERRLAAEAAAGGVAEIDVLRARSEAQRLAAARATGSAEQRRQAAEAQTRDAQARSRVQALRGQLAALDGEAAALAAGVTRLRAELDRLQLRAPVDGTLADVQGASTGSWVTEGQRLATVVPAGQLRVVADFAAASALGRVQPGQLARLQLDGFPWAQHGSLPLRVAHVAREVRDGRDGRGADAGSADAREPRLRVELLLEAAAPGGTVPLQHGLSGRVDVALEDVSPALLLLRTLGRRLQGADAEAASVVASARP